jgi:hypothetical protein
MGDSTWVCVAEKDDEVNSVSCKMYITSLIESFLVPVSCVDNN